MLDMNSRIFRTGCIIVALCCLTASAQAEPVADKTLQRAQEQARRLRQQMQTLQQSADKATQDNAQLDKQLKQSEEALVAARKKGQDLGHRMKDAEQSLQDQAAAHEAQARKIATLVSEGETLRKQNAALQEQLSSREVTLSMQEIRLKADAAEQQRCEANNQALYTYGRELLEAYQNKGVVSALSQHDPVLNLGKVRIENVLEEYRDKLDDKHLPQGKTQEAGTAGH
jgi:chromosome segregation ATPase